MAFLRRRYGAEVFLLYFQAFSGTHAPAAAAAGASTTSPSRCAPFRELIVSTRPDCVDAARADLLASYRRRGLEVWVELGLQSACDATLRADPPGAHRGRLHPGLSRCCAERGIRRPCT